MKTPIGKYQQVEAEGNSALKRTLQVYDIALASARRAQEAIDKKDLTLKEKEINRFLSAVEELNCAMRPEKAPEIAQNLMRLYDFMTFRALEANKQNDRLLLDAVIQILTDLRKTWEEAGQKATP